MQLFFFFFLPSADILLWKHKEHGKVEYGENTYTIGFTFLADSQQATERKLMKSDTAQELIGGAKLQLNF